jgi:hypothetical protein
LSERNAESLELFRRRSILACEGVVSLKEIVRPKAPLTAYAVRPLQRVPNIYHCRPASYQPVSFDVVSSILEGVRATPGSTKLNYFRGYIDGREDYRVAERFLDEDLSPTKISSTIAALMSPNSATFGLRPGLIVNGGLQWSNPAQERLAREACRLAETHKGFFTLDLTLFIGAYGATPFGAHIDDASHRTVLFNLGPNPKEFRVWPRDEVERQFGRVRNIYDIETIEAAGESYALRPGDAFVLPSTDFHIGINHDVSTTVALVIDEVGEGVLTERELSAHRSEIDRRGKEHVLVGETISSLSMMARLRYLSNPHLRYPPTQRSSILTDLRRKSRLKLIPPFVPRTYRLGAGEMLFSRGRHRQLYT